MHLDYQRFLCHLRYSLCFSYLCDCFFSSAYIPFCFPHIWSVVLNSSEFILFMLWLLFQIFHKIFLLKLIWNSSSDALYWWIVHVSFLFASKSMNDCDWMIIFPLLGFYVWISALSLSIWLHCPMVICVVSTICII